MVELVHGHYIQIFSLLDHLVFDEETSRLICVCSMQEMNPGRDQELGRDLATRGVKNAPQARLARCCSRFRS
jgi:hypothetical protein